MDQKELALILGNDCKISDLVKSYPDIWKSVNEELKELLAANKPELFNDYMIKIKKENDMWTDKIRKNPSSIDTACNHLIKSKMAFMSLEKIFMLAATKSQTGNIKFNFMNGYILQKLLFYHDFVRKPASLFWFNFFWRFNSQKNFLMPLVNKKGIYCFYSSSLIGKLAKIIGKKRCIEIACGDGSLASMLMKKGVDIKASDDHSWNRQIEYPDIVENLDAKRSLEKYSPEVVLCSWSPPNNNFEKHIFTTKSVETYIFIGSSYEYGSGNWAVFKEQKDFDYRIDENLSKMVLPDDGGNIVMIFNRKH
jgi:hypothetical protein